MHELKDKAVRGVAWTAIQNVGGRAIAFLIFVVLARLLSPESFGLMAAAAVFLAASDMIMEQGLGQALIQRQDLRPEHLDAVFWAQVGAGLLVVAAGGFAAPWLAGLYHRPDLVPVIRVLLLMTPLSALGAVSQALLARELAFRQLALRNLGAALSGGVVAIAMAEGGMGIWSLVGQQLVTGLVGVLLLWAGCPWRPGFAFSSAALRELMGFSVNLFLMRGLMLAKNRTDQFLIALYLGPVALGFYAVAFKVIDLVTNLSVNTFSQLNLPLFSRLQADPDALRRAYARVLQLTFTFAVPTAVGLIALAPGVVRATFGEKWAAAAPLLRIVSLLVIIRSVTNVNTGAILAGGHASRRLVVMAAYVLVCVGLFIVFAKQGLQALCLVSVACDAVVAPVYAAMARELIGFPWRRYAGIMLPPLLAAGLMLVAVLATRFAISAHPGETSILAIQVSIGVVVYGGALWLFSGDFRSMLATALGWIGGQPGFKRKAEDGLYGS